MELLSRYSNFAALDLEIHLEEELYVVRREKIYGYILILII